MMPFDRMPSISLGVIVPTGAIYDSHHHWHSNEGVLGGFNWSSQHPSSGGVDGTTTGLGCCGDRKAADAVAGPAAGGAA